MANNLYPIPESSPNYSDALTAYKAVVVRYPLLTAKEECNLASRIREGDEQAREQFILSNTKLVIATAAEYARKYQIPSEELIQEGNIGLIKAVERFNPDKINPETGMPYKFSTYAIWWIRQAILRSLDNVHGGQIRMPSHQLGKASRLERLAQSFIQTHEREPTDEELAEEYERKFNRKISPNEVGELLSIYYARRPMSLEQYLESNLTLGDCIYDPNSDHKELIDEIEIEERIEKYLNILSPRERTVLERYFGLNDGIPRTLAGIPKLAGLYNLKGGLLTRERVRQIKEEAIHKIILEAVRIEEEKLMQED